MADTHNDSRVSEMASQIAKEFREKCPRHKATLGADFPCPALKFLDQINGSTFVQIANFLSNLDFRMDRQPIHNERRGAFGVSQNGKIKEDSRPLEDHLFQ
jgi:hypothetical protein